MGHKGSGMRHTVQVWDIRFRVWDMGFRYGTYGSGMGHTVRVWDIRFRYDSHGIFSGQLPTTFWIKLYHTLHYSST